VWAGDRPSRQNQFGRIRCGPLADDGHPVRRRVAVRLHAMTVRHGRVMRRCPGWGCPGGPGGRCDLDAPSGRVERGGLTMSTTRHAAAADRCSMRLGTVAPDEPVGPMPDDRLIRCGSTTCTGSGCRRHCWTRVAGVGRPSSVPRLRRARRHPSVGGGHCHRRSGGPGRHRGRPRTPNRWLGSGRTRRHRIGLLVLRACPFLRHHRSSVAPTGRDDLAGGNQQA
jgi:hypothetical protein